MLLTELLSDPTTHADVNFSNIFLIGDGRAVIFWQ
jgi:hypothetical protein